MQRHRGWRGLVITVDLVDDIGVAAAEVACHAQRHGAVIPVRVGLRAGS